MPRLFVFFSLILLSLSACGRKGSYCPAYDSVHTNKNYSYNPNNAQRAKEDNKKDIEARKKAELSKPKSKKGNKKPYSLFPPGMR